MDGGASSGKQSKKRRGRPPGTHKVNSEHSARSAQGAQGAQGAHYAQGAQGTGYKNGRIRSTHYSPTPDKPFTSEELTQIPAGMRQEDGTAATNLFSDFLQSVFHRDRTEIARVARELDVAENTLYRWMNGTSTPRVIYLKKLPDIFPDKHAQLTHIINQVFGDILGTTLAIPHEVGKDIYVNVLELAANSQDDETRMWHVSQAIFEYALLHMDPEHQGMAVTYAKLMQPHADGIHSLHEVAMRGNNPWPTSSETTAFLGSTSLAGNAAMTQRLQVWNAANEGRSPVEIDEFEHSACAAPVLRNSLLAGVLIFSSTQANFFKDSLRYQAVAEYALLMAVALNDSEFYSPLLLNLRPMPDLKWQRKQLIETYAERVILHARRHTIARREAEKHVQHELELEFEEEAYVMLEKQGNI